MRSIVNTEFLDHLRNARYVIIAAADEGDQGFPGVLAEDANPCEFRGFLLEVRVL